MIPVFYDLETMSECDLKASGGRLYAADPSTRLMCMVAWIDGTYHLWTPHDCGEVLWPLGLTEEPWQQWRGPEMPLPISHAALSGRTFVAHNNDDFDRRVWEAKLSPVPTQWFDTLPCARAAGYPGALDRLSRLFLGIGKNKVAQDILLRACKPRKKGGLWVGPGELAVIASYNIADVVALRAIYEKVKDFTDPVYETHLSINSRGILFDRLLAAKILDVSNEHVERAGRLIAEATGGQIKPTDLRRRDFILAWIQKQGVRLDNLRRDTVQLLLDDPDAFLEEILDGEDIELQGDGETAPVCGGSD